MAQGGRSEWERQLAAQRREAERQAREAARHTKEQEKVRQAEHVAQQQRLAETKTAAVTAEIDILDHILVSVLDRPPITFDGLKVTPKTPSFQPGKLAAPLAAPAWQEYAPVEPRGIDRWFGGMSQYRRDVDSAR